MEFLKSEKWSPLFQDNFFGYLDIIYITISMFKGVYVSIYVHNRRSTSSHWDFENQKNTKGSPLWNEKKFLSPILLKFFLWDPFTIRISNFGFFFKKKFFKIFPFFPNARGPPKNFDVQNFKFFGKRFQKQLYWVLANIKRNKVTNFGELSSNYVVAAGRFMVVWVNMTQSHVK